MSDRMRQIPFEKMLNWIFQEFKNKEAIFGIHKNKFYKNNSGKSVKLFGEVLTLPIGPAAGPNSQLAQNIVSSYLTGSRFIELKTVQLLDGEDLPVSKPCIYAQDEGYNVEWSTELRVPEAFDEYIKAWFLIHVLMKELKISDHRDFMFNMSVGYDLEGIKSKKIDDYIEGMKDASNTDIWRKCKEILSSNMNLFSNFDKDDLENISPIVCSSITLSTLHGCPPQEIERIANYLLKEKNLNTFIKMNPTLLGESFVRETLNIMGYEYITLNGHHFIHDLQYDDGIEMLKRLKKNAKELNLEIGVKLTNTLPVKITNGELPGEEMYMSGRSLFPLSINLASKLAEEFEGDIHISYSGGADFFNIDKIIASGIQPVTFATTILKPGGYERITQIAEKLEEKIIRKAPLINVEMLKNLSLEAIEDKHYRKELRKVKDRKLLSKLPTYDCAVAPCTIGCPINQKIPKYVSLVGEKKYDEAFSTIIIDNTSPGITSSICNHNCQFKCTRIDYDDSVSIRNMKKIAVLNAQDNYIAKLKPNPIKSDKKVGIIGAGSAGLAAALFLRRNGMDVTVMDKRDKAYGIVEYVIPEFRISSDIINKDFEIVKKSGVKFKFGVDENFNINELKKEFDYIIIATGAWKPGYIFLEEGTEKTIDAVQFLEKYKRDKNSIGLGNNVCIIGGGDVAMDAARAAKRMPEVENVSIIYRRTKQYMPADKEELDMALDEGINIRELLSPLSFKENKLICEIMSLGERDSSGRRSPISTGKTINIDADSVIVAIGEQIDKEIIIRNGIQIDSKGFPAVNEDCETSVKNVYVAGDVKKGPATIVKAIADGKAVANDILSKENLQSDFEDREALVDNKEIYSRKGILKDPYCSEEEATRCLSCNNVCELCIDVCPNRANFMIETKGSFKASHQVIHLDGMCNECGNCGIFCPHDGNPYKEKITIFWTLEDFNNSTNKGFLVDDIDKGICKVRTDDGRILDYTVGEKNIITEEMEIIIRSCIDRYSYIL